MSQHSAWFVPGRIEVLGKHTDYAAGRSLVCASSQGITLRGQAIDEPVVRVRSDAASDMVEIGLRQDPVDRRGHWSGYPAAVVARLVRNFGDAVGGVEVEVTSTLPLASGMSSSSAMIVGLARVLIDLGDIESTELFKRNICSIEDYAHYLACIENGQTFKELEGHMGVGTFGGSQDHTAIMCSHQDQLSQFSFCPTRREADIDFPSDYSFVVAVSGVLAEKSGQARELYNRASLATTEIVKLWNQATGRSDVYLNQAVQSSPQAPAQLREIVAGREYLPQRLEQFLVEAHEVVPGASAALRDGDLAAFGQIVDRSQHYSEHYLGNQVPETVYLQASARRLGASAASAFGAGFGGSVWALVPSAQAEDFAQRWLGDYRQAYPEPGQRATALVTRPGPSAHRL